MTEKKLTPKMRKVLEAAQQAGTDRTITAVCEEAGVNRRTFYRWLEYRSDFAVAWDEVWHKTIARHLPGVVSALLAKAKKGDVSAARLIADMKGVIKQKHEVTTRGTVVVTWDDD